MFLARDTTTSKGLLNAVARMPPKTPLLQNSSVNDGALCEMGSRANQNFNAMVLSLLMPTDCSMPEKNGDVPKYLQGMLSSAAAGSKRAEH
jgi:hypothetical protein